MSSLLGSIKDLLLGRAKGESPVGPAAHFAKPESWTPVSSSNVHSIAYFTDVTKVGGGTLRVRFKGKDGGGISEYEYSGVPIGVYTSMLASGSKGRFVWHSLRDRYSYRRLK